VRRHTATLPLQATHPDFRDRIVFELGVLSHLQSHRQRGPWATEAGGQLFGRYTPGELRVTDATGPYRNDQRSRTRYRSDPLKANTAIQTMVSSGLLYLGEWHTHPEAHPHPSGADADAFAKLCRLSTTRMDALIMAIQGQDLSPAGLTVLALDGEQLAPWTVRECVADTKP
jgi:integrative and conjugative element protein (TIGR02256 family)